MADMLDATWLLRAHARRRLLRLGAGDAQRLQTGILLSLIRRAAATRFARDHDLAGVRTIDDYRARVPVRSHDDFWDDYWSRDFPRLVNCTWPGLVPWFAETSGTTRGTTRFIPFTREMNRSNRRAAGDLLVWHVINRPRSRILAGRVFILGGSTGLEQRAPGVTSGDLSGITASVMPRWARLRSFPPRHLEAISDWNVKIDRFASASLGQPIHAVCGVPSWLLIYFDHLLEISHAADGRIASVYPGLELLVHGGVSWAPYRERFAALLEGSHAETREVYAASEGFFAMADRGADAGLRLQLDNAMFFEFAPLDGQRVRTEACRWIGDVEEGVNYALVVSTAAGLWRYLVGDTVTFTTLDPPRIRFTGRTAHMLSAFGEHVIVAELEEAVSGAARAIGATVSDFAVGSIFSSRAGERGNHLYVIEFSEPSIDEGRMGSFAASLDRILQSVNADYAAHRAGGWGMDPPRIEVMPSGGFAAWMAAQGKLGGQHKVPRVIADQARLDALRDFARRA
ncbi:MAG: GH3 auxin-responsive promoter family protein [bacterium]|nr:GH3 auxin-responsive promoter family protein [bacterium]MDE0416546.1 GH3 auxin-responsive promoter family protein [bacterium]